MKRKTSFAVACTLGLVFTIAGIGALSGPLDQWGIPFSGRAQAQNSVQADGTLSNATRDVSVGNVPRDPETADAVHHAKGLSRAFRYATETTMPTVVTIRTESHAATSSPVIRKGNPLDGSPLEDRFRDFFGDEFEGLEHAPPSLRRGLGSGVIIDKQGLILTNNHVVAGADKVMVHLADGRVFETTDIRTDPESDLAVLRLEGAGDLPAARLGDSQKMAIGDWVLAIGNPFELESTVSAGIISGKGRQLGAVRRASFLQTDAAINPGNSGGPLINLDGEVIGINTAIASNSGGYQGIGFAIPSNHAKWVVSQLVDHGEVRRAYLGVSISDVTPELARKFKIPVRSGVLVMDVLPDSPAAKAGFEPGDLVTHFDNQQVRASRELQSLVERAPTDDHRKHEVRIRRDGEDKKLQVAVELLSVEELSAQAGPRSPSDAGTPDVLHDEVLGIEVSDMTEELAQRLGYEGYEGVVVTSVDRNKPAFAKNIRAGMLIRRVDKTDVATKEEFLDAMEGQSLEDGIMLLVRTQQGNQAFIVVTE
jgi:serine protease Do